MTRIELNDEETRLVKMLVESRLSTLAIEIAHTDTRDYREMLHRQREALEAVLGRIPPVKPS